MILLVSSSSGADRHSLDSVAIRSILCSAGVLCTTIQAQDFKDVEGDRLVGRETLAIVAPETARRTLMPLLLLWSLGLCIIWQLHFLLAFAITGLAFVVGARFIAFVSVKSDQHSYYIYNVSASFLFLERTCHSTITYRLGFRWCMSSQHTIGSSTISITGLDSFLVLLLGVVARRHFPTKECSVYLRRDIDVEAHTSRSEDL